MKCENGAVFWLRRFFLLACTLSNDLSARK